MNATVLVADDDAASREALAEILTREGYNVIPVRSGAECMEVLEKGAVDLVITDLVMPGATGLNVLKAAQAADTCPQVILVTGYGTIENAVDAMRSGAFDYLTKPIKPKELKERVRNALERRRLERENAELHTRLDARYGFDAIVGKSQALERILDLVRRIATTRSTVLLTGESGTGKELIAGIIHQQSPRRAGPLVKVNCAAIVETLLESELFGHVQGAFTGAIRDKAGKFELADGGTIFLDEIAEMSPPTQAKLLRVLQEGEIERVGGISTKRVDVRVVAATNRNLEQAVASGAFREDLYYRLKVVRIEMPPLRNRTGDIPLLLDAALREFSTLHGRPVTGFQPAALERLMVYPWPGNVRELRNAVEGMVVTTTHTILAVDDLPPEISRYEAAAKGLDVPVGATIEEIENEMIRRTLEKTGGNRTQTSKLLGISLRTLQRKLKALAGQDVDGDEAPLDADDPPEAH